MGLRDKVAPNDTPLERELLSENIDVARPGRFYPEDFSGRIQAVQQEQSLLSEIPKSLAGIVEHTNDYKINMWSEEQDRLMFSQAQRNEIFQKEMEHKLQLDTKNSVSDMFMQMKSTAFERLTEADKKGDDLTPVAQELYQEFAEPAEFESNWEAQKLWADTLQNDMQQVMPKLWETDLKKAEWLAQKNMSDTLNSQYANVRSGKMQPFQAMNSILQRLIAQGQDLSAIDLQKNLNASYNELVPAYAEYIVDMVKQGQISAEQGYAALKDLRESCTSAWFDCESADGKRLTNSDGSTMRLNFVLSTQAQEKLYRTLSDCKNASGASDALLDNIVEKCKQDVGWKSIQELGSSDKLARFKTPAEVKTEFDALFDRIANSSAKDSKKMDVVRELYPVFSAAYNTKMIGEIAKVAKKDLGAVLQGFVSTLQQDINEGKVKAGYNLKFSHNGKSYDLLSVAVDTDNPVMGDADTAARLYWDSTLEVLTKQSDIINNQGGATFLHHFDYDYKKQEQSFVNLMQSSILLASPVPGSDQPIATQQGVALIQGLQQLAGQYGYDTHRVTTQLLADSIAAIEDPNKGFDTPAKKMQAMQKITDIFTQAGEAGVITRYMNQNIGSAAAQTLYLCQAVSTLKSQDIEFASGLINFLTTIKHDPKEVARISEGLKDIKIWGTGAVAAADKIYDKYKIPQAHRDEGRMNILKQHAFEYAVWKGEGREAGLKYLEKLVDSLYIKPDADTGLKESIYRFAPQYLNYVNAGKEQEFKDVMKQSYASAKKHFKQMDLPGLASDLHIISDDEQEAFRWRMGDKDIEVYDVKKGKYITPSFPDAKQLEQYGVENAAKLMATNVVSAQLSNNDAALKRYQELLHKNKEQPKEVTNIQATQHIQAVTDKINNIRANSPLARYLTDSQGFVTKTELQSVFSFKNIRENFKRLNAGLQGQPTGQAAPIELGDIAEIALADSSYVGKIQQTDMSEPIMHAAVGNDGYIDVFNTFKGMGYTLKGTQLPGVTMDYAGPTGGAAPIQYTGSRTQAPTVTNKEYTKQEITDMVNYYADMFGINRTLAQALVTQESGGQQHIKSHAGAIGVTQLMPGTAKGLGVTNPEDAAQNIWGGMKYLHQMLQLFKGNVQHALAAYNAGPGAVQKAKGVPNIPETKNYVKNICSRAGIAIDNSQYPVDIAIHDKNYQFIDPDTNMLRPRSINDLVYVIQNAHSFKGKVNNITTNRPELLEDKPEYADFAKYRTAKNSEGKPLFVRGDVDGFRVNLKKSKETQLDIAAVPALAEDAAKTQTDIIPQVDSEKLEALLTTCVPRYTNSLENRFGLARLTAEEYEDYGVPISAVNNPMLQSRVLAQEFQRAIDILGNERKAVYALMGGQMADEHDNIKTWDEIKRDKENFTKNWFIKPTTDDKKREEVNTLVAMYNTVYNQIRGI